MSDFLCDICDRSLAKFVTTTRAYCSACYKDSLISGDDDLD